MNLLLSLLGPILPFFLRKRCIHSLPHIEGVITLKGLNSRVEIIRDRWGIPHIRALDMHDLLYAQGFVHAQDRLWQMDFDRRVVSGKLSEIFGKRTLDVDRWMRTLGLRRAAEGDWRHLGCPMRLELEAYSEGVNAYIASGQFPIEFRLLRYHPVLWSPVDTLSWNKMMSWGLSGNWESELIRKHLKQTLGEDGEKELESVCYDLWPTIIPKHYRSSAQQKNTQGRPFTGPGLQDGIGSNCWVVAGSRTRGGKPLLANDMHLMLVLPSIWYENHLTCGDYDITGITAPGVPNIITGHNGHVAWGYTAGNSDVQDLYIEHISIDKGKTIRYEYRGKWQFATVHNETIGVRGGKSESERVVVTRHGPLINGLTPGLSGEKPLSLRWAAFENDSTPRAVYEMLRARSCSELHQALRHWTTPNVSVLYADIEGNIGYSLAGKIPIRRKGKGRVPVPGWSGEYEWEGFIPFEELPHLSNPVEGYIVSANNRVAGNDYPYYLGTEYCIGDRAQRITEMLTARSSTAGMLPAQERLDMEYMKAMQKDLLSPSARRILRYLKPFIPKSVGAVPEVVLLNDWDGALDSASAAAGFYQVFVRCLLELLLSEKFNELADRNGGPSHNGLPECSALIDHCMGKGVNPVIASQSMFIWHSLEWLQEVLSMKSASSCDSLNHERIGDLILAAFRRARDVLARSAGPDMKQWSWGRFHTLTFLHPLGQVKPLGRFFNRGPLPIGGDGTTIWASNSNMHDLSTGTIIGPPYRSIIDLGALDDSLGALVPGQSGNPASTHYDDQIDAWFNGEYHPLLYSTGRVDEDMGARLELIPAFSNDE